MKGLRGISEFAPQWRDPACAGKFEIRNSEFEIRKGGIWSVEGATGKVRG